MNMEGHTVETPDGWIAIVDAADVVELHSLIGRGKTEQDAIADLKRQVDNYDREIPQLT